ncbi:MAG: elongation factor P [Glaciecola sp.]|jgi:elongation factor P
MVSTNNLKNGMTLLIDGKLKQVVENQHHKPGKGQAVVRTKLKDVESGKVVDTTFRAGLDVEQAIVERKALQFLYREQDRFVFMDTSTFEQKYVEDDVAGNTADWLLEGETMEVAEYDGRIITVDLPASVELDVTFTEPGLAGDTASGNASKPATLETGVEVQVPLFIKIGEKIKVDTRTGKYLSRA